MNAQPYLFYNGRCAEALDFYTSAIGAKVQMMMKFKDSPDQTNVRPEQAEQVMHSSFAVGDSVILASDGEGTGGPKFEGFGIALSAADAAAARTLFDALSAGGQVRMPLMPTFFSPAFGMVADRFGILWMVMVEQGAPQ